jgi:(S)-citramalyl-CoA lyase
VSAAFRAPRSWLFVPASRPDRFDKALASGAGAVIFDLEDAVAEADKASARAGFAAYLAKPRSAGGALRAARINRLDAVHGGDDLASLAALDLDVLVLPKVETARTLDRAAAALEQAGSSARVAALIESPRGVGHVEAIVDAAPARLAVLMFGAADYATDLGVPAARHRPDYARARVVNAAAMAGLAAIDSPFFTIADAEGLAAECRAVRDQGYGGKLAIHPGQIGPIETAFAPTADERELARRILEACGDGAAATLDGRMVDEAMARWARRVAADET